MTPNSSLEQAERLLQALQAKRTKLLYTGVHRRKAGLKEVEQEIRDAQVKYAMLHNENVPVLKLPRELLEAIFQMCSKKCALNSSRHRNKPFQIIAAQVSRSWREIALGTPMLWSSIDLNVTQRKNVKENALQWLLTHLTRSKDCLLYISLKIAIAGVARQFLTPLIQHSRRWRHLSIALSHGDPGDIHNLFSSVSAPGLTCLSLRMRNSADFAVPQTKYSTICNPILSGGAPALASVRLSGKMVGNVAPPLSAVTTLFVEAFPNKLMSYAQFRAMLTSVPCIVNLSLSELNVHLPSGLPTNRTPLSLPTLRSLWLHGSTTPGPRLLSFLSLPNLKSLTLLSANSFDSVTLPSVRSLSLEACNLGRDKLSSLCRAFPSITDLSIDGTSHELLSIIGSNLSFWPNLETLSLSKLLSSEPICFNFLVQTRAGGGGDLCCVRLDARSFRLLRAMNLLIPLQKLLSVEKPEHRDPWAMVQI